MDSYFPLSSGLVHTVMAGGLALLVLLVLAVVVVSRRDVIPAVPVVDWVAVCPPCGWDGVPFVDPRDANGAADDHNDAHHGGRSVAFPAPIDAPQEHGAQEYGGARRVA